jgi:hypothetical protein
VKLEKAAATVKFLSQPLPTYFKQLQHRLFSNNNNVMRASSVSASFCLILQPDLENLLGYFTMPT